MRKYFPTTILDVFPEYALQVFLYGLYLKIRRGVSIVYGRRGEDNRWNFHDAGRVDPYNAKQGINPEFVNPICFKLRSSEIENHCKTCDEHYAGRCASESQSVPEPYKCWLGFWEVPHPVRLGSETIAFVFAGQIPPDTPSEQDEVRANLSRFAGEHARELIGVLDEEIKQRSMSGTTAKQETATLQEDLGVFVEALQRVMTALHASAQRTSVGDLLAYWESSLPTVDHMDERLWWQRVAELTQDFLSQLTLGRVTLLVRAGKYFYQHWPRSGNGSEETGLRVAARDVLEAVPPDKLMQVNSPFTQQLVAKIAPDYETISLYRTRAVSADAQPGLLFAVEGVSAPQYPDLGDQFLRRISSRTEHAALAFQLKRTHEQYKLRVSEAAHDFRHPLQILEFLLARLNKLPSTTQDRALIRTIAQTKLRLLQAVEQTLNLQTQEREPREVLNLVELLDEVIEFMGPKADAHPCRISRCGTWPGEVKIKADRSQIFRVFLNLIDNAIKYSFMGDRYPVEIRVFPIDFAQTDDVKVTIRNFGVGIPADRLEQIRKRGTRGEVHDDRLQREGTGIGLSIVERFLDEHGGTFEIESNPAQEDADDVKAQKRSSATVPGLRYATIVTVHLKPCTGD